MDVEGYRMMDVEGYRRIGVKGYRRSKTRRFYKEEKNEVEADFVSFG